MTQSVPMFDPFTGQPLKPLYDPYTGLPLAGVSTVQAEDAVTVHPTANGGLHDGATSTILDRLQALEDRITELEHGETYPAADTSDVVAGPDVRPNLPAPTSGTADTSSIRVTGGVNGGEPAEQSLLESATVPTNDPNAPELAIPTGEPVAFTDERDAKPVAPSGVPFTPDDER